MWRELILVVTFRARVNLSSEPAVSMWEPPVCGEGCGMIGHQGPSEIFI